MNEILDNLKTIFSAAFTTRFKAYFKGRIVTVNQSNLPILMVIPIATRQKRSGTIRDNAEYDIAVEIRINVKGQVDTTSGQGDQLDTLDALVDLIEERESDGDLQTDTVMGILNANLTCGNRTLFTDNLAVQYEEYMEANKFPCAKAIVTFTAYDRPNRV